MSIHGFQLHWQPIANNKLNPILTVTTTNGLTVITFEVGIGQHSNCSRYHHQCSSTAHLTFGSISGADPTFTKGTAGSVFDATTIKLGCW